MSSLRDDLNARAYADGGCGSLRRCRCSDCEAPLLPACSVCGHDEIALDEDGHCADCAPREDETCEDYSARLREIRGRR